MAHQSEQTSDNDPAPSPSERFYHSPLPAGERVRLVPVSEWYPMERFEALLARPHDRAPSPWPVHPHPGPVRYQYDDPYGGGGGGDHNNNNNNNDDGPGYGYLHDQQPLAPLYYHQPPAEELAHHHHGGGSAYPVGYPYGDGGHWYGYGDGAGGVGWDVGGELALQGAEGEQPKGRKNLPLQAVDIMMRWMISHIREPFPTEEQKLWMAAAGGIEKKQVEHWFINARRRKHPKLIEGRPDKHEILQAMEANRAKRKGSSEGTRARNAASGSGSGSGSGSSRSASPLSGPSSTASPAGS